MTLESIEKLNEMKAKTERCCDKPIIIESSFEKTCENCGMVIEEVSYEDGCGWREPYLTHTKIGIQKGKREHDARGNLLNPEKNDLFFRLIRLDRNSMSYREYHLKEIGLEFKSLKEKLGLPQHVEEESKRIYEKGFSKKLNRGRKREDFVAGAILIACRKHGIPVSFQEIVEAFPSTDSTQIFKAIGLLKREVVKGELKAPRMESLIVKHGHQIGVDEHIIARSVKLWRGIEDRYDYGGKNPIGVVAGLIYVVANDGGLTISHAKIFEALGVSPPTIRARAKEISKLIKTSYDGMIKKENYKNEM